MDGHPKRGLDQGVQVHTGLDAESRSLPDVARKELEKLSERTQETVLLGTRVGGNIVYLEIESRHTIRYAARLRERRPLFHTSMGKIYLASMAPTARQRFLRRGNLADIGDVAALVKELETVEREQVAYNREETVPGVMAAASGVRGRTDALVAAVSVAGPSLRMAAVLQGIGMEVRATALEIGALLGARSPAEPAGERS